MSFVDAEIQTTFAGFAYCDEVGSHAAKSKPNLLADFWLFAVITLFAVLMFRMVNIFFNKTLEKTSGFVDDLVVMAVLVLIIGIYLHKKGKLKK